MSQKTVHFSVEGEFLTELARDLFVEDTPKKAVRFLTESLIGMPEELAIEIVTGKKRLTGTNDVLVEDDPLGNIEKNGKHPDKYGIPLTFESAWNRISRKYFDELAMLQMLQRRIMHYGRLNSAYGALYRDEDGFKDTRTYEHVSLIDDREKYKNSKEKFNEYATELAFIAPIIGKTMADLPVEILEPLPDFIKLNGEADDINFQITFDMLLNANIETLIFPDDKRQIRLNEVTDRIPTKSVETQEQTGGTPLDKFLKSQREIDNKLKEPIKPNPITDNNSAGWLAPNGDWYGLDGEISNMLHNQIADALYDAGLIPNNDENRDNPDSWLAGRGWIKIHGQNILFEGYENTRAGRGRNVTITDAQQEALVKYAKIQPKTCLKFGFRGMSGDYNYIKSAAFIEMATEEAFERLFKI